MINPYNTGTFKHDFIELWNTRIDGKWFEDQAMFYAEIAELIMIAGIHGNVYEGKENGQDTAENQQTAEATAQTSV